MQYFKRYFYIFAWLAAVALYIRSGFVSDSYAVLNNLPVDPVRDVQVFSLISVFECIVLMLVIRPWSFQNSWGRLLAALALFFPWFVICFFTLMHAPPVQGAHAIWLLMVVVALGIALSKTLSNRDAA
jgi:hypothetical protein